MLSLSLSQELHALIEHNRITHELLSQHTSLGSYDEMLAEIDESSSLTLGGRILSHVIAEVVQDLAPNFCYNSVTSRFVSLSSSFLLPPSFFFQFVLPSLLFPHRFIRPPFQLTEPVQRPHMPKGQPIYLFGQKVHRLPFH